MREPLLQGGKRYDGLNKCKEWIFGVGHLLNDLVGAMWFNYGLYYLVNVQKVSTITAGLVFLVGQIVDAAATPLVGYISDKTNTRIGKRKPSYIFGTIVMPISYFFIFQDCYPCQSIADPDSRVAFEAFWYSLFAGLFNMGWAAIQIAHMALIPALTPIKEKKDRLISLRNAFTFIANIVVLVVAFTLFNTLDDPQEQFKILVISVLAFGILVNIVFLFSINEVELCNIAQASYTELGELLLSSKNQIEMSPMSRMRLNRNKNLTWKDWMKSSKIYWIGMLYMLARLSNNFTTGMIPFYLVYTIQIAESSEDVTHTPWQLAVVPLVMYLASVLSSFTQSQINNVNRKLMYVIGCAFMLVAGVPLLFLQPEQAYWIFAITFVAGIGFSIVLNSSMGFISAFVGGDAQSGAFVWGVMGLLDKLSSGLTVFLVTGLGDLTNGDYTRMVTCIVLLASAVIGPFCSIFIKHIHEYSEKAGTAEEKDGNRKVNNEDQ